MLDYLQAVINGTKTCDFCTSYDDCTTQEFDCYNDETCQELITKNQFLTTDCLANKKCEVLLECNFAKSES